MTAATDRGRQPKLRRELGPLLLAVYGTGTILGAGIYWRRLPPRPAW